MKTATRWAKRCQPHDRIPSAECDKQAIYSLKLDRYHHADGSDSGHCCLLILRHGLPRS